MATIKDIARRAGVGVATVSRALNRTGYVKPTTLKKVLVAADELGYVPNRQARAMVNGATMTLGILIPDMDNSLFMRIVRGINDAAYPLGYSLLVMDSRGNPEWERQILRTMLELRTDGVILFATPGTPDLIPALEGTPLVVLDRLIPNSPVPQVSVDHYHGARQAVELLLKECRYPPAFLAGPTMVTSAAPRLHGYLDALENAGIAIREARIVPGNFTYEGGYHGMTTLLSHVSSTLPLDGVFAANDLSALGALRAIREAGFVCPDDIRVVGFDDIEAARYVNPTLSTIRQPMDQIGQTALRMLLSQIRGQALEERLVMLPGQLIRRESC